MNTDVLSISTTNAAFSAYFLPILLLFTNQKGKSIKKTTDTNNLQCDSCKDQAILDFQLLQTFKWTFYFVELLLTWSEKIINIFLYAGNKKCRFYFFRLCCHNKN